MPAAGTFALFDGFARIAEFFFVGVEKLAEVVVVLTNIAHAGGEKETGIDVPVAIDGIV